MPITVVTINIEGSRHLKKRVLPFLKLHRPDVVCMQEVFETDVAMIERELGMNGIFVSLGLMSYDAAAPGTQGKAWGLLTLTRQKVTASGTEYYYGDPKTTPVFYPGLDPNIIHRAFTWLKIQVQDEHYTVINTHFTWSFAGEVTPLQRQTLKTLFGLLRNFREFVLVGDFNTPRGGRIYADLASRLQDNIPPDVTTTIDNQFHRSTDHIEFVIDGIFTTPGYCATSTQLTDGLSDHLAVMSSISLRHDLNRVAAIAKTLVRRTSFLLQKIPRWIYYKLKSILHRV